MQKIVLGILTCMIVGVLSAQEQDFGGYRFTLDDCLNYALGNNYNLQSMKLSEEASEEVYQQSKKERLPSLSASAGENIGYSNATDDASWTGSYGLSSSMTLYQGGTISNTIQQNKLRKEQSVYQTSQYENNLTLQILQAFLTILGNEELLKYQEAVIAASEEQVKQGKDQFQLGKILESDYLLLEAQYANDKNNIVDTQIALDNSLLSLKNLLSMPATADLRIVSPDTASLQALSLVPPLEEAMERTIETLPDLKIQEYNIELAKIGLKLSKANYLPTVSLHGSVASGHTDFSGFGTQLSNRLTEQLGVSVSIPIFDNNRTKSQVAQKRIALKQAELDKKQNELDIRQTLATEHRKVTAAYNKYQTTSVRQNAYSKTFDVYRAQFNAGSITAVDLLQQQNNYISALNDYIQSKYEFILRRKILDVYMGVRVTM